MPAVHDDWVSGKHSHIKINIGSKVKDIELVSTCSDNYRVQVDDVWISVMDIIEATRSANDKSIIQSRAFINMGVKPPTKLDVRKCNQRIVIKATDLHKVVNPAVLPAVVSLLEQPWWTDQEALKAIFIKGYAGSQMTILEQKAEQPITMDDVFKDVRELQKLVVDQNEMIKQLSEKIEQLKEENYNQNLHIGELEAENQKLKSKTGSQFGELFKAIKENGLVVNIRPLQFQQGE